MLLQHMAVSSQDVEAWELAPLWSGSGTGMSAAWSSMDSPGRRQIHGEDLAMPRTLCKRPSISRTRPKSIAFKIFGVFGFKRNTFFQAILHDWNIFKLIFLGKRYEWNWLRFHCFILSIMFDVRLLVVVVTSVRGFLVEDPKTSWKRASSVTRHVPFFGQSSSLFTWHQLWDRRLKHEDVYIPVYQLGPLHWVCIELWFADDNVQASITFRLRLDICFNQSLVQSTEVFTWITEALCAIACCHLSSSHFFHFLTLNLLRRFAKQLGRTVVPNRSVAPKFVFPSFSTIWGSWILLVSKDLVADILMVIGKHPWSTTMSRTMWVDRTGNWE